MALWAVEQLAHLDASPQPSLARDGVPGAGCKLGEHLLLDHDGLEVPQVDARTATCAGCARVKVRACGEATRAEEMFPQPR